MSFPRMKPYMLEELGKVYEEFGSSTFTKRMLSEKIGITNQTYSRMVHRDHIVKKPSDEASPCYCLSDHVIRCILEKQKRDSKRELL